MLSKEAKIKYEAMEHEAAVLFIKHGFTLVAISQQLHVSMPTLKKWKDAGRWEALRPDLEIMNQYKASAMFLQKGMNEKEISINLGVPEVTVNFWADLLGWNTAKLLTECQNNATDIIEEFCQELKELLPKEITVINFVKTNYLKSIKPKI